MFFSGKFLKTTLFAFAVFASILAKLHNLSNLYLKNVRTKLKNPTNLKKKCS